MNATGATSDGLVIMNKRFCFNDELLVCCVQMVVITGEPKCTEIEAK